MKKVILEREQKNFIQKAERVLEKRIVDEKTKEELYPNGDNVLSVSTFTKLGNFVAFEGKISVEEVMEKLGDDPNIKAIYPNEIVKVNLINSVPFINANQVWTYNSILGEPLTGRGTVMGIVDTGVDYTHPDLGGCLGPNCKVIGGYDFVNNDNDPMDDHGQGTHVAATAAGNGSYVDANGNVRPILGVAPDAKILAIKVLGAEGIGTSLDVIRGMECCVDPNGDGYPLDRVDVCSLSLGGVEI